MYDYVLWLGDQKISTISWGKFDCTETDVQKYLELRYLCDNSEHGQYREVDGTELFSLVSEVRIERLNLCKN